MILLFSGHFPFNQDVLPEKYVIFLGLAFGLSAESNLPLIFFFFLNCSFEGKSGLYCFTVCCSATHANGHPSKAHYISNMLYNNYGTKMLLNEKVTVFWMRKQTLREKHSGFRFFTILKSPASYSISVTVTPMPTGTTFH